MEDTGEAKLATDVVIETRSKPKTDKTKLYLYTAMALSSWGDRVWYFAVGIYFITLNPTNLQAVAFFGVTKNIAAILLGPAVGDWIDRSPRLYALRTALYIQNSSLAAMALLVVLALYKDNFVTGWWLLILEGALILMGAVAILASIACKVSISKDWVVALYGSDTNDLAHTNASLRRIDLLSDVLGPIITGSIMAFLSRWTSALFIAIWNMISLVLELYLYTKVYHLGKEKLANKEIDKLKKKQGTLTNLLSSIKGISTYRSLSTFLPGLSLALLYMTVLSFDSVTRAYIIEQNLSEAILGIANALGSVFGIVGTLLYPIFITRIGLVRTGVIGFWSEFAMLLFCLSSLFAPGTLYQPAQNLLNGVCTSNATQNLHETLNMANSNDLLSRFCSWEKISVLLLITGITLNRFGLWTADLSVNQLQQERIPADIRGSMGGTQNSLNGLFDMLRYILIVILPKIPQFGYHIILSVLSVFMASLIYSMWTCSQSSQLLPPAADIEMATLPNNTSISNNDDNQEKLISADSKTEEDSK